MNIVYVSREFGPVTGGGIGTYIYNVVRAMADRGHNVYLVTDCFHQENRHFLPEKIKLIETLSTRELRKGCFVSYSHEYSYRVLDTLRKLVDEVDIDVIEFAEFGVEGFSSIRAKRLLNEFSKTKLIVKLHTPESLLYYINEDKQINVEKVCEIYMEDYCVTFADVVTSPSQSLADYFSERLGRKDILRCPYPMELPDLKKQRQFSAEQIKRVRFIGSIQVRKGVDVFIEAAKLVLEKEPGFIFEMYGELLNATYFGKTYIEVLERNIPKELSDKIIFRGGVKYSDIPDLLLESCFCIFPSRWENWANACLEAMSMGCVVIASRNGGMGEMITHGKNGFLMDPLNPQDIADVILDYQKDYHLLHTISRAAHYRSKEICDPNSTARRIESNYMATVKQRSWSSLDKQDAKVSVIIPYFNQPDYLQAAVDSVNDSHYQNFEIVVVNDGSTTPEALQAFDKLDGVVKVSQSNGGLGSARNAGIAASSGQFILPLDADDKIHPDYIKIGVEALVNNPELSYVSCHAQNFGAFESSYIPVGYVSELMPFINTDGKCTNLFRRSVFEGNIKYDEIMTSYEDWDFLLSLHEKGYEGDVIPEELFFYRRNYDSMVYTIADRQRVELIQYMMIRHKKLWEDFAPTMATVLANLWKNTEVIYESHTKNLLQIYFPQNNKFTEINSVAKVYPKSQWISLDIHLPSGVREGNLRLDPSNQTGTIIIKKIQIIERETGVEIWRADYSNHFKGCAVLGDDENMVDGHYIIIKSVGNDPQILLKNLPFTEQPVTLNVTLRSENDLDTKNYTYCFEQKPVPFLRKYLADMKAVFSKTNVGL